MVVYYGWLKLGWPIHSAGRFVVVFGAAYASFCCEHYNFLISTRSAALFGFQAFKKLRLDEKHTAMLQQQQCEAAQALLTPSAVV